MRHDVGDGARRPGGAVAAAIADVRARGVPHNVGRAALRTQLAAARAGRPRAAAQRGGGDHRGGRRRPAAATATWVAAVDRLWPPLSAPALVRRLLTNRAALAAAADGLLIADEQAAIRRRPTRRLADEPWTAADLVARRRGRGARSAARPASTATSWSTRRRTCRRWALRALARRSPARLDDRARRPGPGDGTGGPGVVGGGHRHLGAPPTAQRADLDLGYRVPASIMDCGQRPAGGGRART